ncbi:MAG: hypothetical protein H7836_16430 [Magnetococcus sp. YQC-3]
MLRNKSLIYPLIFILFFVLCVALGLGYMVSRAVLQDVRHTLMVEKAKWVADAMQKNLEETINHVSLFKESWVDSLTWVPAAGTPPAATGTPPAATGTPPAAAGGRGEVAKGSSTAQFQEKWDKMRQLFPLWQVDFLLILDPSGKVLYQLPESLPGERPFPKELLDAAQQELNTQDVWMTLDRVEGQLAVQVFTRLPNEQSKGLLVVFGQYLEKIVTQLETDHPELTFLLADGEILLGADPIARDPALLKPELIEQAIEENRHQFDDNTRLEWNLYYAPLQLLDQIVCLVVPIELKSAHKILHRSQKKLRQAGWFILLALVLAGAGLTFLVVLPLRRLQGTARQVVAQCVEEEPKARNEIFVVGEALRVAARTLEEEAEREVEERPAA